MHLHDRLAYLIAALGETPVTFSEKLGIQRSSVSHLLSARNKPSVDFLEKLLAVYPSVNLTWLITGSGNVWMPVPAPETESGRQTGAGTTEGISPGPAEDGPFRPGEKQPSGHRVPSKVVLFYPDGTFEVFHP